MKNLFDRITNNDLPMEYLIGFIGFCVVIGIIAWAKLAGGDAEKRPAIRRGFLPCLIGIAGIVYFMVFFDVSVSAGGQRVANLDLMSRRQNGIIVSGVALICGVVLSTTGGRRRE